MAVEYLHTNDAPGAIGPYSQATKAGGFLFTAGQIALDPVSTQVVEGDVAAQACDAVAGTLFQQYLAPH